MKLKWVSENRGDFQTPWGSCGQKIFVSQMNWIPNQFSRYFLATSFQNQRLNTHNQD